MPKQESWISEPEVQQERHLWRAIAHGFRSRCPSCGEGAMFAGFLKVRDRCESCGEELHHHRADDLPPYLTIFAVGHIVVPLAVSVELAFRPNVWLQSAGWCLAALTLCLLLLPRIKGAVVGLQWANRMHGFGGVEEFGVADHEHAETGALTRGAVCSD